MPLDHGSMRSQTLWTFVSLFVFIITFAGVWTIIRLFTFKHGGAPALTDGLLAASAVAICTTGFMAGFGYLIIFGAINKEEQRDDRPQR